jgi:hypothetical protein
MMLSLDGSNRERPPSTGFLWGMALLVLLVGVIGVFHDSPPAQVLESWMNVHALFALLLWGLVIARFCLRLKYSALALPSEIRDLSRQLSRMVYLLLYAIIGIAQVIDAAGRLWQGGTFEFRLGHGGIGPGEDFQAVVGCGLVALLVIRVLAFGILSVRRNHPREERMIASRGN